MYDFFQLPTFHRSYLSKINVRSNNRDLYQSLLSPKKNLKLEVPSSPLSTIYIYIWEGDT